MVFGIVGRDGEGAGVGVGVGLDIFFEGGFDEPLFRIVG